MGLGGITEVKKLLPVLFPKSIVDNIDDIRTNVDLVIEDMSIYINNVAPVAYSHSKLKHDIRSHLGRTFSKFPRCILFASLIDDGQNTPLAKKPTQKKRAARPHLEPHHKEMLGELYYPSNHGNDEKEERGYIEGALGNELREANEARKKKKKKGKQAPYNLYINRVLGTRALKADVAHLFTRELLKTPRESFNILGTPRTYILDGAVWPGVNDAEAMKHMNPLGQDEDDVEGETTLDLGAERMYDSRKSFEYGTCSIWMSHDAPPKLSDPSTRPSLGEADIKIVSWLRELVPIMDDEKSQDPENRPRNLWIKCCDTDLIPILLLWMRELIDPKTHHLKHNVYLDCTSSKKENEAMKKKLSKDEKKLSEKFTHLDDTWKPSVEVYDMGAMWKGINKLLLNAFPGIYNPIEVFCLMLMSAGTDFLEKPRHIGFGAIWKAFCLGGYAHLSRAIKIPTDARTNLCLEELTLNENRPVGIVKYYIVEFYRLCYTVSLLNQRHDLKLVDENNSDDKYNRDPVLESMEARFKKISVVRREANTLVQNIQAYTARISFHQNVVDAVNESRKLLEKAHNLRDENIEISDELLEKVAEAALLAEDNAMEHQSQITLNMLKKCFELEKEKLLLKSEELSRELADYDKSKAKTQEDISLLERFHMRTKLKTLKRGRSTQEMLKTAFDNKRIKTIESAKSRGKAVQPWRITEHCSDKELAACASALAWNFDYWYRGPAAGRKYTDISAAVGEDGKPVFGWVVDRGGENDSGKRVVVEFVHDTSESALESVL